MAETVVSTTEIEVPSVTAEGQAEPILSVQKVRKSFGGLMAVVDMSLEVTPGAITGLIGA